MGVGKLYSFYEWKIAAPMMEKRLESRIEELKPYVDEGPWMGRYYENRYEVAKLVLLALTEAKKMLQDKKPDPDFGIPSLEEQVFAYAGYPVRFFKQRFFNEEQGKVVLPEGYECLEKFINVRSLTLKSPLGRIFGKG